MHFSHLPEVAEPTVHRPGAAPRRAFPLRTTREAPQPGCSWLCLGHPRIVTPPQKTVALCGKKLRHASPGRSRPSFGAPRVSTPSQRLPALPAPPDFRTHSPGSRGSWRSPWRLRASALLLPLASPGSSRRWSLKSRCDVTVHIGGASGSPPARAGPWARPWAQRGRARVWEQRGCPEGILGAGLRVRPRLAGGSDPTRRARGSLCPVRPSTGARGVAGEGADRRGGAAWSGSIRPGEARRGLRPCVEAAAVSLGRARTARGATRTATNQGTTPMRVI